MNRILYFMMCFPLGLSMAAETITVENVSSLRACSLLGIGTGTYFQTSGYYSAGDGGAGTYVYSSTSIATDNGGTIIAPTSGSGRWLLQYTGPIRAEWFGATGTHDYGAALSAAFASLGGGPGTITVNANSSGVAITPINFTGNTKGVTIQGMGSSVNAPVFTVAQTGVGIDCTGSGCLTFRDFYIQGSATTVPTIGYLMARNSSGNSAQNNQFFNSGTVGLSEFSVAALYDYASESDRFYGGVFDNDYPRAKVAVWTANNISNVSSSFVTIATGSQSCTDHQIYGTQWYTIGGAGSNVLSLDQVSDFHVWGGFIRNDNGSGVGGNAMIYIYSVNGSSSVVSFRGVRFEIASANPNYGFYFDDTVPRTFPLFTIENCTIDANTSPCYASDNASLDAWHYQGNWDVQNSGVSVYTVNDSEFVMDYGSKFTVRTGGALAYSRIVGKAFNTKIPAARASNTTFYDTTTANTTTYPTPKGGGGIIGMPNGVTPLTGVVGETINGSLASGSAVSLSTGTASKLFAINIPSGGNWRLFATIYFINAQGTTSTTLGASLNTKSASLGAEDGRRGNAAGITGNAEDISITLAPPQIITTTGPTTYYVNAVASFRNGTCSAFGSGAAVRAF